MQALSPVIIALRQGLGDNLVAVVLFGSRARGDATEASDWDLLVLARQLPSRKRSKFNPTVRLRSCNLMEVWRE